MAKRPRCLQAARLLSFRCGPVAAWLVGSIGPRDILFSLSLSRQGGTDGVAVVELTERAVRHGSITDRCRATVVWLLLRTGDILELWNGTTRKIRKDPTLAPDL